MTPRTIGSRSTRCRAICDSIVRLTCAISPLGVRTATAQLPGPRIITPSRTACPPTVLIPGRSEVGGPLHTGVEPTERREELLLGDEHRLDAQVAADLHAALTGERSIQRVRGAPRHDRHRVAGGERVVQRRRGFGLYRDHP